jgi:hypothetical protein
MCCLGIIIEIKLLINGVRNNQVWENLIYIYIYIYIMQREQVRAVIF